MNSKFRCLTIGYIEARKGQDILVEAVRMLDGSVRDGCEFLLVGQDTSLLAQGLKKSIENLPAVRILGTAGRNPQYLGDGGSSDRSVERGSHADGGGGSNDAFRTLYRVRRRGNGGVSYRGKGRVDF